MKYRYFPFLGVRKLDQEYKDAFGIPDGWECTALMFEWLGSAVLIAARCVKTEKSNDNGN
jgi:hypothetical protein